MELVKRLRLGGPNAAEVAGEAADEIERLLSKHPNPADFRYWEGRYRDEKAEVDRLRNELSVAMHVVNEACKVVDADTYVHPMLSREDAVKAGVMGMIEAVGKWRGSQPAAMASAESK